MKTGGPAAGERVARTLGVLCLLLALSPALAAQARWTRYVDPFVGTGGHGHTFPGATLPFGMVQLSPDTRPTGWDGCSGYHYSDSVVYGFSHTHLSGTGVSDYGDILFMPTVGQAFLKATEGGNTERGYASRFSHARETASPGYYSVRLDSAGPRARIFYTLDGTEPGVNSTPCGGGFDIERSTLVKAVALEDGVKSTTAAARFRRIEHGWTVRLLTRYSAQHTAGGDEGLLDGVRGSAHFADGAWQGYQGRDFEAVVDLGRVETVKKLGAGFLQNVGSWILMPTRVEFALSSDGEHFLPALAIDNEVPDANRDAVVKDFVRTIPPARARFVRVKAYNYGKLPAWHPGSGGDAYVFIDEIIVE